MNKAYERIVWKNEPSLNTPLNETNLNKMDVAINEIDNRVLDFDTTKAKQSDLLTALKSVTYNSTNGKFKFTWFNGNTYEVDLNVEKIPVSFSMSAAGVITMVNADGTKYTADVSTLIKTYSFVDSSEIDFSVSTDATGNKTITASLVAGSITEDKLRPDYLAEIKISEANAAVSATNAAASENSAEIYKDQTIAEGQKIINDTNAIKDETQELAQYAKDAAVVSQFWLDTDGNLVYEDNTVHIFTVDDNGNLLYEVRGTN